MKDWKLMHNAYHAIDKFIVVNKRKPKPWDYDDTEKIMKLISELLKYEKKDEAVLRTIIHTYNGTFNPLASFIGGIVSQEAIKGITKKYTPINQIMYYHSLELAPATPDT